ncbi:hypothetical protein ACUY4R_001153 [Kosakonia sp. BK9b]
MASDLYTRITEGMTKNHVKKRGRDTLEIDMLCIK